MGYFKTIRNGEKLQRRSKQEWQEKGTKEEALELVEFQNRKKRNNEIMVTGLIALGLSAAGIALKKN